MIEHSGTNPIKCPTCKVPFSGVRDSLPINKFAQHKVLSLKVICPSSIKTSECKWKGILFHVGSPVGRARMSEVDSQWLRPLIRETRQHVSCVKNNINPVRREVPPATQFTTTQHCQTTWCCNANRWESLSIVFFALGPSLRTGHRPRNPVGRARITSGKSVSELALPTGEPA